MFLNPHVRILNLFAAAMVMLPMLTTSAIAQDVVANSPRSAGRATTLTNSTVVTPGRYYCSRCQTWHQRQVSTSVAPQATAIPQTAGNAVRRVAAGSAEVLRSSAGIQNVLSVLNRQRSRQGLRSLRPDPALQAVAERRAQQMASMGTKSHPPGSFSPGRYEGVGWSSSYSPNGVYACYTSDPSMSVAGAAMATGRDGVYFAVVYR
ncbi:CAP domain-containing protein [Roseiconus lacunae]|uniref:CAP domain-containing protein n=1 Tax=Roseiconus lacunae TaxID=2605694 RepID=A0ABT7PKU2_9BACT|nr:CAP domain-containing protein [Roseiconus lacunae]MDM4017107.1 CAP domain-containing protein [Roseiconus lacunae]